jgi:hypothetical protein
MNLVELCAEDDEQKPSPCEFGNIVIGHSCYCHHENGPRKCHVWRMHGDGPIGWDEKACPMFKKASNATSHQAGASPALVKTLDGQTEPQEAK